MTSFTEFAFTLGCSTSTLFSDTSGATDASSRVGSEVVFADSTGLIAWMPLVDMNRVWPSGADFAAASPPRLPPAPGRFSTVTGWPSVLLNSLAIAREAMSTEPAGGNGQINRSGLEGKSGAGFCAAAWGARAGANTHP